MTELTRYSPKRYGGPTVNIKEVVENHTKHQLVDMKDSNSKHGTDSLKGDYGNIMVLTFLYVLQGIPLGLGGSIPMLLQSRKVTYKEQAMFSFVSWPFSIKLLWAPLVDSLYFSRFGRRKTWMVPTQYLIGLFMLVLSTKINYLLGEDTDSEEPTHVHIFKLTVGFFCLNFLAATQDIAVDGWALTMLARRNVGWASTCNTVGHTAGYFLGNVLFLALESADFCNKYLRSEPQREGIVTLASFLYFWGVVFFVTTTLVWIFKPEHIDPGDGTEQGIVETYKQLYKVIRLPSVLSWCLILLTAKIAFAAADSMTHLKLIEAGMEKANLAMFAVPMVPIQIILPLVISRYTTGPRPLEFFLKAIPFRIVVGFLYAFLVYLAHHVQSSPGQFPAYFYLIILVSYATHQVFVYSMFVSQMAFHVKISDPAIGGSYMTLLNTVASFGGSWPVTFALWLVDSLTWKSCDGAVQGKSRDQSCYTPDAIHQCREAGGHCYITLDGYYILHIACAVIGIAWYQWKKHTVRKLDSLDAKAWKVS